MYVCLKHIEPNRDRLFYTSESIATVENSSNYECTAYCCISPPFGGGKSEFPAFSAYTNSMLRAQCAQHSKIWKLALRFGHIVPPPSSSNYTLLHYFPSFPLNFRTLMTVCMWNIAWIHQDTEMYDFDWGKKNTKTHEIRDVEWKVSYSYR